MSREWLSIEWFKELYSFCRIKQTKNTEITCQFLSSKLFVQNKGSRCCNGGYFCNFGKLSRTNRIRIRMQLPKYFTIILNLSSTSFFLYPQIKRTVNNFVNPLSKLMCCPKYVSLNWQYELKMKVKPNLLKVNPNLIQRTDQIARISRVLNSQSVR